MANPYFAFKQFTVWHDKCSMKVGTDGVLLGAWASTNDANTILDVGTGTGLIALMLAQRCDAEIDALDIVPAATQQALENIAASPWPEQIKVYCTDYACYEPDRQYDLIVSNPPYFCHSLKSPDALRTMARHTDELTFETLIAKTADLLSPQGIFSLIIPADVADTFIQIAGTHRLHPIRQTYVRTTPGAPPKRILISFAFEPQQCHTDEMVIELSRHVYSDEYKELTREYYLK